MEPSSAEDGDKRRRITLSCSPVSFNGAVLSRGRRPSQPTARVRPETHASMEPSSAEDGDPVCQVCNDAPATASMEPSSAEDGDQNRAASMPVLVSSASMEPSSAEDGDMNHPFNDLIPARASMEPSSAEDGDKAVLNAIVPVPSLQWSRPQQRTETGGRLLHQSGDEPGFNGAVLSRGRRRQSCKATAPATRSFNGAVLSRGRRPADENEEEAANVASMEPSSAEDGDPAATTQRRF